MDTNQPLVTPTICKIVSLAGPNSEDVEILLNVFFEVLDMAAEAPGGWNALIEDIRKCARADEVLAFCKSYTMIVACAGNTLDDTQCVHDGRVQA